MTRNIASFWYTPPGGKGISKLEFLTIKSWLDHGFNFILYTYNLSDKKFKMFSENFPNFHLKDANEIVPLEDLFLDNRGGGLAAFSDYFRFKMIHQTGIPWTDMDMVCLKHSSTLDKDYLFIKEKQMDHKEYITTSLLKFPAHSDFGRMLIQRAQEIIAQRKKVKWGCIGPLFLSKCVQEAGLEHHAFGYQLACQIPFYEAEKFVFPPNCLDKTQFCLHLYTDIWRQKQMRKDAIYHPQAIYSQLMAEHDIDSLLLKCHYSINFFDKYIFVKLFFLRTLLRKIKSKIRRIIRGGGKWVKRSFKALFKRILPFGTTRESK